MVVNYICYSYWYDLCLKKTRFYIVAVWTFSQILEIINLNYIFYIRMFLYLYTLPSQMTDLQCVYLNRT